MDIHIIFVFEVVCVLMLNLVGWLVSAYSSMCVFMQACCILVFSPLAVKHFILFYRMVLRLSFMLQDSEIVGMCLSALNALASYHFKEKSACEEGLGTHAAGYEDPNGTFVEGILSRFLRSLLQLLLFEDYRSRNYLLIDSLSD